MIKFKHIALIGGLYAFIIFALLPCHALSPATISNEEAPKSLREEHGKLFQELVNYELDNALLITLCVDNISDQLLRKKLLKMKDECEENIQSLSKIVKGYGREPSAYSRDSKGFLMGGYAMMQGGLTDVGAMRTLYSNQQIILKAFERALNVPLPFEEKEVIKNIYERKMKSLRFIEDLIVAKELIIKGP